jgi:hypothetical protein
MNCGEPLGEKAPVQVQERQPAIARSVPELLQVLTIRMVVILLGLWLLKVIINALPFVKELRIPKSPLPVPTIINTIVLLIIIGLFINYSRMLWVLWPQALPRLKDAGTFLVLIIYIVILIVLYYAAEPIVIILAPNREALTILQIVLFGISLLLLIYAISIVYTRLPSWLPSIRQQVAFTAPKGNSVVCLNCGQINKAEATFCSSCGQSLEKEKK